MERSLPWLDVVEVLDPDGSRAENQGMPLCQVTDRRFKVGATLRYLGETGLDPSLDDAVRTLPLDPDRLSDLASVPPMMGWFERPHGAHTPAALFHDHLLVVGGRVSPTDADRMFRFMLKAVGVPTVKRYLLWAAVVLRTRWETSRLSVLVWVALSIAGLISFVAALVGVDLPDWTGGRAVVLVVAGLAPLPASLLWGREWIAALVAAVMAIWILPAAAIALAAIAVYQVLERTVGWLRRS